MRRSKCRNRPDVPRSALLMTVMGLSALFAQQDAPVPQQYKDYFVQYVDRRSIVDRILNSVGLNTGDVGRSFALIAGVSYYPNMSVTERELKPASEDIRKLQEYLRDYEFFDEIVVLKDGAVTTENLEYFLQTYFPQRLRKFPKSRFLFAYSGHGMTLESKGYLLKNTARNLRDRSNCINLNVVRAFVDEVVTAGHHVLVLLNACYGGAFLRRSFGEPKRLIPKNPGAHAITAGGTGERTWHIPRVGTGSVFFEKFFAGLDGRADPDTDGVITAYELFSYLKREVQLFTDQDQNPQVGDLTIHGSKGEFFFLNRDRQVAQGVLPEWKPAEATSFGIMAAEALAAGKVDYESAKYETALTFFRQSAEQGDDEAMFYLGYMYELGLGVPVDNAEALRWYHKSAEAGNGVAMNNIGVMYQHGNGVLIDYAEAVRWYRKAANAGDAYGISNLAWMYREGRGVPKNYEEAIYWFNVGASKGHGLSLNHLGWMYQNGLGVTQDYHKAVNYYRMAMEAGDILAMGNLGWMYQQGIGVEQNYAEALRLTNKAAEADEPHAMRNLAFMYEHGLGVEKNYEKMVRWCRRAAEIGHGPAMTDLGYFYRHGLGVEQNYAEALRWYRKAIEVGEPYAMNNLGLMYQYGTGVTQNYSEAVHWYHKAAEAGHAEGMYHLGRMYENGLGVEKNYEETIHWYRRAAEAGSEDAKERLKELGG